MEARQSDSYLLHLGILDFSSDADHAQETTASRSSQVNQPLHARNLFIHPLLEQRPDCEPLLDEEPLERRDAPLLGCTEEFGKEGEERQKMRRRWNRGEERGDLSLCKHG